MALSSLLFFMSALIALAIRDFINRSIELYYYILAVFALTLYLVSHVTMEIAFLNFMMNTIIMFFLTGCLLIYFIWKTGVELKEFFRTKLGIGDLMFWVLVTPLFAPFNFLLWMILSLFLTLVFYLLFRIVFKYRVKYSTIPLAGFQSMFLAFFLLINHFVFCYNIFDDPLFK